MAMENRAAQFAPFAALSGHDDAIAETARLTESFRELSVDEQIVLTKKLNYAIEHGVEIVVTYFIPDCTKQGGAYGTIRGTVTKYYETDRKIVLQRSHEISLDFIREIEFADSGIEL